jgi:DNA repair exonuclease SbcCD nuclease subunit
MGNKQEYWLITADNQLGAIHWNNPQREEDYYHSFQSICKAAAKDEDCLGVLGVGDVRERATIQAKNLEGMNLGLQTLLEAGKPMLALMGNHDYTTPNWIESMCYPCLHNLADKAVQKRFGFDPDSTLALDFRSKGELEAAILANCQPADIRVAFLHQSLRELTTNLKQSYDTSLIRLEEMGFGSKGPCLIMLGDLHNYGDSWSPNKSVQAVYPGSPEMTDANEGSNGLRSDVLASEPHDYRKFVVHYFPKTQTWKPVEIEPRPWFRGKAKTSKETIRLVQLLQDAAARWPKPGVVALSCPRKDLALMREALKEIPTLEARVEEYDPTEEETTEVESKEEATLSWPENKRALVALAEESGMDSEALALLQEIVGHDGSTPNVKNDVARAWMAWNKEEKPEGLEPTADPTPETEKETQ